VKKIRRRRNNMRDELFGVQHAAERRRGRAALEIARGQQSVKMFEGAIASLHQSRYYQAPKGVVLFIRRLIFTLKRYW
jgi:hypothetical protein